MEASYMLEAFEKAGKRVHVVGDLDAGVIIALDMEGRLFTMLDGEVMNHVNLEAIAGESTQEQYLLAGGDGLWPAPEGTSLGYCYSSGSWRVPPGVRSARYLVNKATKRGATVVAEVDLINNQGLGIPTIFKRKITIEKGKRWINVHVLESITYLGRKPLHRSDGLLVPWTLSMLDSGPGCYAIFPCEEQSSVWDLYEDAKCKEQEWSNGMCRVATNGSHRFQIATDEAVPWVEFHNVNKGLVVKRQAEPLAKNHSLIDISDVSPDISPGEKGVRYSVYSDTTNFMEIEVAGGCSEVILPDSEMSLAVSTRFTRT